MSPIAYIKNLIKGRRYKHYKKEYYNLTKQEQSYRTLEMYQMQREALDVFFKQSTPCAMLTMALMDRTRQKRAEWEAMLRVMEIKMRRRGKFKPQSFILETMYTEMLDEIIESNQIKLK
ncbi:hypothetical protein [Paenibacillus silvae]|uniref:Uncharacterized protein n=1 Tax=Paenibacillus silvae TaxID=1325358 RepID=A0A2W6QJV6_9BACL|nr:hypothetical protein [Paenibacillus silvae]PZT57453.1 hypothetical protein DN757_02010 [Paenibacillus silvae]